MLFFKQDPTLGHIIGSIKVSAALFVLEEKVLDSKSLVGKAFHANEASSFFCSLSSLSFQSTKEEEKGKNSGELPSSNFASRYM